MLVLMARVQARSLGSENATQDKGIVMLVLSRKSGEKILIGENVSVTIVRIGPNTVRIGIDAPREMNIVRDELCQSLEIELPVEHDSQPQSEQKEASVQ